MSLRIFHVIFIIVCIALCAYVAIWGIREFSATRSNGALALTGVFVAAGAVLIAYSKRVFKKLGEL